MQSDIMLNLMTGQAVTFCDISNISLGGDMITFTTEEKSCKKLHCYMKTSIINLVVTETIKDKITNKYIDPMKMEENEND